MTRPLDSDPVSGVEQGLSHNETLEKAFQDLSAAFYAGDSVLYERIARTFTRDLTGYWRDRVASYKDALKAMGESKMDGRRLVVNGELLEVTELDPFHPSQKFSRLWIERPIAQNSWDKLEMRLDPAAIESTDPIPESQRSLVVLQTVLGDRRHPEASAYNLKIFDGLIYSFKRITQAGSPLRAGYLAKAEEVGYRISVYRA